MTAFLQLEECLAQKKDAGIPIQEKRYIFVYVYLTLTCFSTICLVRLLSCQIGFRWAAFTKAAGSLCEGVDNLSSFVPNLSISWCIDSFHLNDWKNSFSLLHRLSNMRPFCLTPDLNGAVQLQRKRCSCKVKFRYSEKVTKIWKKNLPYCFDTTK